VQAMRDHKCTSMFGSPALIDNLSRYCEAEGITLPTLKRVLSAGAPVRNDVLARMAKVLSGDAQVFTPFGATESLPVASIGSREVLAADVRLVDGRIVSVPAVSVALAKRPGTNAVAIAERIIERLHEVEGTLVPDGLTVQVTRNYGETANEKANELLFHLGLATVSIVLLVAFAIGWREAVVVAVVIPTTILLTLFAARVMGYTLNRVSLFALILVPADVDSDIVRPAPVPTDMADDTTPQGVQYWAGNLTDTRLSNAIQTSINNAIRQQEYTQRNIDVDAVRDVQRTRLPVSRLDPGKVAGDEQVSLADTFRQWAPMGFVYLIFISLMQSVQYLLSNTIEEKSNRIIEVLLASVTPGELMMGKLLGIGATGITTIVAWLVSFFVFIRLYQTVETAMIVQILDVLLSSDLIPYFVFYYVCCYALYAGIFLAIGSLCNTLKEAQSLMMPLMMVLVVPILTMSFIAQDPNGTMARVMSWIPLFTPFTMMNRAAAQPPMFDVVGTTILLVLSTIAVLWLSGRVFRQGILRTGQPPRILELWRMLRKRTN
jgi:ABC-type Na+ efflux pump permease subunit